MLTAATYNRNALGQIWNIQDLPPEFPGRVILLQGEPGSDAPRGCGEPAGIDWEAFSQRVREFQAESGLAPEDGKLGPATLRKLRETWGLSPSRPAVLKQLGDLGFQPATVPVSAPAGPPLRGRTPEEQRIADLWNRYGAAIFRQAHVNRLPLEAALAVFSVEAGQAYDPQTGLVIIRFEPHIFRRRTGQEVSWRRGGQEQEWRNLARAYALDAEAALCATSYGLPQLMGFNWQITGHANVAAMALAFQDSCLEQVAGFFAFVQEYGLGPRILKGDWREFTRRYNGPGNVEVYTGRLLRALQAIRALSATGAAWAAAPHLDDAEVHGDSGRGS